VGNKTIATNRKAFHNYYIEDGMEAGIVLSGTEIKSLRDGRVNLGDAYVRAEGGELWLYNAHIARYDAAARQNHEPLRKRKLLLHRREINGLSGKIKEKGLTLLPIKIYLKKHLAKVQISLGKGKKQYDKREVIARREIDIELGRALKNRFSHK
jgi:SsrA-binding protein